MKSIRTRVITAAALMCILILHATCLRAEEAPVGDEQAEQAELAKKLQNPVANLISVPFQNNWDFGIGKKDGMKYTVNIQPVIPVSIAKDWNVIIRTIVPVIYQEEIIPEVKNSVIPPKVDWDTSQSGLGDTVQSFFFSPKEPVGGWVLALGPVGLYPSATDDRLGGEQWGAGPTGLILRQEKGWTYGALANHIWSFAGDDDRDFISATFLQPFVSYTTKKHTTFSVNTESTYNWHDEEWTVPINVAVAQLLKIGKMPVQFQLGGRYYAEKPQGGPDWGLRFAVTFLFPKK